MPLFTIFKRLNLLRCPVIYCLMIVSGVVSGHAGGKHAEPGIVVESSVIDNKDAVLPIDVGGPFSLIDHNGNSVTDQSYAGRHMLVFFGYTDCQIMCSISLSRIGDALRLLDAENENMLARLAPIVITVDPQRDAPEKLKRSLAAYHPALLGLTGTPANLEQMYQAYNQSPAVLEATLNDKHVVSHSSYFYLMGPDGSLQTLFPPILNSESMANILKKYIGST